MKSEAEERSPFLAPVANQLECPGDAYNWAW